MNIRFLRKLWKELKTKFMDSPCDPVVMDFYLNELGWGSDDAYPEFCMGFDLGREYGRRENEKVRQKGYTQRKARFS